MWSIQWLLRPRVVVTSSPLCRCAGSGGHQVRAGVAGVQALHSRVPPAAPHTASALTSTFPYWHKSVRRRTEWHRQHDTWKQFSSVAGQTPSLTAENNLVGRVNRCSQRLMSSRKDITPPVDILNKDREDTERRDLSGGKNSAYNTSADSDTTGRGNGETTPDRDNVSRGSGGVAEIDDEEGDEVDFEALVKMEVELARQEGHPVPSSFTPVQWQELLTKHSVSARRKFIKFLFIKEMKKIGDKQKKEIRKQQIEERYKENVLKAQNSEHIVYGLWNNTMFLRIREQTMAQFHHGRCVQALMFGQSLVFDLGFDKHMNSIERQNCADQLQMLMSDNRRHSDPYHLHLCNFPPSSDTFTRLHRFNPMLLKPEYPVTVSGGSYLDCYPRDQLVYLTPHCQKEMTHYDHNATYIVGGIVDKGSSEPLTLAKAKRERIHMQKFPLDRYLDWGTSGRKSLTLNQVVRILLDMKVTGDWNYALRHVPRRKVREPWTPDQLEDKKRNMLRRDRNSPVTAYRNRKK